MTRVMHRLLDWFDRRTSGTGLLIGALFVVASSTPSLIPRSPTIQAILAGFCFASGYGATALLTADPLKTGRSVLTTCADCYYAVYI